MVTSQSCCCPKPTVYNVKFHFRVYPASKIFHFLLSHRKYQEEDSFVSPTCYNNNKKKKAGVRVKLDTCSATVKFCRNFLVLRPECNKFVFTIFPRSGHVNVSGVKDFSLIPTVLDYFNTVFRTCVSLHKVVIDNSTASGYLQPTLTKLPQLDFLNLRQLQQYLVHSKAGINLLDGQSKLKCHLSLRPHYFPGGVFKSDKSTCTVILFTSKKYIIVGAKCEREICETQKSLCAIITQSLKTNIQVT